MTVRKLIEALNFCNPNAEVFIGNPNHFGSDYQTAHEDVGVRYVVNGNKEVWFETYGGENIEEEYDAIAERAMDESWTDWDFIAELFGKDNHGYTIEDIKRNCSQDKVDFVFRIMNEYEVEDEREF